MQTNFIKNLLNLEDVIIKNVKNLKEKVEIYIELPVVEHKCPHCGKDYVMDSKYTHLWCKECGAKYEMDV